MLVIGCLEYFGAMNFPGKFFNHEVDHLLYRLDSGTYPADYLLIGDSVGLQLFRQFERDRHFKLFASNQAIEMTGQYFLVQRYLEQNPEPKAVIFASRPFQNNNLIQVYTENFVFRTFTRPHEILEIFRIKRNPAIFCKMVAYALLPSFKYRLKLQSKLVNFTNADVYTGLDGLPQDGGIGRFSLLKIFREKIRTGKTSPEHFKALAGLLHEKDIDFFYIPMPVEKQKKGSYLLKQYDELFREFFPGISEENNRFHYFNEVREYPAEMFVDHVHFNDRGLPVAEKYVNNKVKQLMSSY